MPSTSVGNLFSICILSLFLFLGVFIYSCHQQNISEETESEIELNMMHSGSDYLEKGYYTQAYSLYTDLIIKYPTHPYVDDAAYRLAYITIIADEKNPYFDYKKGLLLFQNFIENYPNSRYINACQNWVNLLTTLFELRKEQSESDAGNEINSSEINHLKNELKHVQAENARLKKTLEELQKAIER